MIIRSDGGRENCGNPIKMIKVKIELQLVESLIAETSTYTGTVLLCELRDSMQTYIRNGLLRGCNVSIRKSFDYAWSELVMEDENMSESSHSMLCSQR